MPQSSRYKIYIIDEVHMLSTSAFNALLKTLEEPPAHVVFIFATTEPHKIPETVHSRCQQYDFKMIPLRRIYEHLADIAAKEQVNLEEGSLRLIARKAEGSMRDAMSYLDQAFSFGGDNISAEELQEVLGIVDRQVLVNLSEAVLAGSTDGVLDVMERMARSSWDVKQFYGDLMEHFRNLVVAKVSQNPEKLIDTTTEEIEQLQSLVRNSSLETLQRLFSILMENEEAVLRWGYPRIALEMTVLNMAYAAPVVPLDQLTEQLAAIKQALQGKGGPVGSPFPVSQPTGDTEAEKPIPAKPAEKPVSPPIETPPKPAEKKAPTAAEFIASLRKNNENLAVLFEDAQVVNQGPRSLTFAVEKGKIAIIEGFKDQYMQVLRDLAGGEFTIEIEAAPESTKRIDVQKRRDELAQRTNEIRRESRKNLAVQWIVEQFEHTEVDVEPLDEQKR